MKVFMINSVCGIRSTGRICTDLAAALAENGHEARIAFGREEVPEQYKDIAVRIGSGAGVKLHALRARLTDGDGTGSRRATEKLMDEIERFSPDVVHLHNIHGYYINTEVLFRRLRSSGVRTVWTLHDCWSFTGHAAFCEAAGCEKWRTGCGDCPNRNEYPASVTDRSAKNWERKKALYGDMKNLAIVCPSRWLSDMARESFLGNTAGVYTIYNGIDLSNFYPKNGTELRKKLGIEGKTVVLGVAAIWNERKGLADFVRLSEITGGDTVYVLIGLDASQTAGLPDNIIGIGRTNDISELAEYYSMADVFLLPTYLDNFPSVNIEALACGTPVITYRTGGSPEAVTEKCGKVLEKGDIRGAAELIAGIRGGYFGSAECAEECAERAKLFSKENMCREYLELYGRLSGTDIRGGYTDTH